jgi:adenine-specific DNA methylase
MIFTVKDLKQLAFITMLSCTKDDEFFDEFLREDQPYFYDIIDEIGRDPRCHNAYRFCTHFCVAALIYASDKIADTFPAFSYNQVHDSLGFITRKKQLQLGRRAITYPDRIQKHVLFRLNFDEDDSRWLCTTISTFLVLIENAS